MISGRFWKSDGAAAAAEFALVLPFILPLIFIAMEAGNFFWSEQKLIQAVREGARYASRLPVDTVCSTTSVAWKQDVRNVTRFGNVEGTGRPKLPGWTDNEVVVETPENCEAFVDTGIYSQLGKAGPIVSVKANGVEYFSLLKGLGVIDSTARLASESHAAVIGI